MGILRLDVDRQGYPWAIGCDNWTYHWNGKGWDKNTGAGFDNITFDLGPGKSVAVTEYEVLTEVNSVNWIPRTGGIPQRALALGYLSIKHYSPTKHQWPLRSIYACRVISEPGNSSVGWTIDGNICNYADLGKVHTNMGYGFTNRLTMEILVRDAGKVVHLNLAEKK